jgi:hypothetical protein
MFTFSTGNPLRVLLSYELTPREACHCVQCRKFSGHYPVGTHVPIGALTFPNTEKRMKYNKRLQYARTTRRTRRALRPLHAAYSRP